MEKLLIAEVPNVPVPLPVASAAELITAAAALHKVTIVASKVMF